MTTIVLDLAAFRSQFPAFSDPVAYPDAQITAWFSAAQSYISAEYSGGWSNYMTLTQATTALYCMTAMWGDITGKIASGDTPGIVTSATIDKVTVATAEPPVSNQWQYWLASSPYGQMLLSLLQLAGVGGKYYPGYRGPLPYRRR